MRPFVALIVIGGDPLLTTASHLRHLAAVITTASRDGNIHVYDLRVNALGSSTDAPRRKRSLAAATGKRDHPGDVPGLLPVNVIQHAHAEKGGKKPNASAVRLSLHRQLYLHRRCR